MSRLNDNVYVDGRQWPKGCRPPEQIAEQIGEHAWEDGDPTVDAPPLDVDEQNPATTDAPSPAASVVDPATLDGSLMGPIDDEPDDAVVPDDDAQAVVGDDGPDGEGGWLAVPGLVEVVNDTDEAEPIITAPVVDASAALDRLPDPLPPEPKRAGRGASREAWVDHATRLHLDTTDDQSRDDIIAMVDAHLAQFKA